jgi:hypothetical protein
MTDRNRFAALDAAGIYLWAAALAVLSTVLLSTKWWHPYCDAQADGPGFFAWGAPLPYAEPTGVSSLEFTWMPHVLALDLALMGCAAFVLLRIFFPRGTPMSRPVSRISSTAALAAFLVLAALHGTWLATAGIPRWSTRWSSDHYSAYRPNAFAAAAGHRSCDH